MQESERTISSLRLYRSAHTPAKGDSRNVGTNPQIIEIVIIRPDWVFRVIYQRIAY
ncbi:hypothetical protein D3C85_1498860 [compost metagenome]